MTRRDVFGTLTALTLMFCAPAFVDWAAHHPTVLAITGGVLLIFFFAVGGQAIDAFLDRSSRRPRQTPSPSLPGEIVRSARASGGPVRTSGLTRPRRARTTLPGARARTSHPSIRRDFWR